MNLPYEHSSFPMPLSKSQALYIPAQSFSNNLFICIDYYYKPLPDTDRRGLGYG